MQNEDRKLAEFEMIKTWHVDCDWDDVSFKWLLVRDLLLPKGKWSKDRTNVLLIIPDLYPMTPPTHCFIDSDLTDPQGNPPRHVHQLASYWKRGWAYYCLLLEEHWKPSMDITEGDNLFKVLERVRAGLS